MKTDAHDDLAVGYTVTFSSVNLVNLPAEMIIKRIPDPPPYDCEGSDELIFPVEFITREEAKRRWPNAALPE